MRASTRACACATSSVRRSTPIGLASGARRTERIGELLETVGLSGRAHGALSA